MKKTIVVLAALLTLGMAAQPQTQNVPAPQKERHAKHNPEDRAKKHAERAQKNLGLDATQMVKWQAASLERIKANEPFKSQMRATSDKAEKHKIAAQMKPNTKKFDDTVNGFLTADQKTKWEQIKKEKKEKHANGRKTHD